MNSCIDISVSRVSPAISIDALKRINPAISIDASKRINPAISIDASKRINPAISIDASKRIDNPIEIRCGLVCSIASDFYLEVQPESIWLIPDNGFSQDVVVYANVSWVIE